MRETLTQRETDVARLLITGATNAEIGEAIGVSDRTIEVYIIRMKERLGIPKASRVKLAVELWKRGIREPRGGA